MSLQVKGKVNNGLITYNISTKLYHLYNHLARKQNKTKCILGQCNKFNPRLFDTRL